MVVDLATVEQVLNKGKDMGASDIHITVGIPPMVRVNGSLIPLDYPELSPEDTQRMVYSLMNDKQRAAYEEERLTFHSHSEAQDDSVLMHISRRVRVRVLSVL